MFKPEESKAAIEKAISRGIRGLDHSPDCSVSLLLATVESRVAARVKVLPSGIIVIHSGDSFRRPVYDEYPIILN